MNNELYHYGVPGMRWGVITAKAVTKFGKRDSGLETTRKLMSKYDRRMRRDLLKAELNRLSRFNGNLQSAKYQKHQWNWAKRNAEAAIYVRNQMSKHFDTRVLDYVSNDDGVDVGSRYVDWLLYSR